MLQEKQKYNLQKALKRLIFVILLFPFATISGLLLIIGLFTWIFADITPFPAIDYLKTQLYKLL